jgi:ADP-ribosylglycohydrolase/fructose-1,6-bisphosphatase/inositol monophosphatase family enzyme
MSYHSELELAVRAAEAAGTTLREAFHDSRVSGHVADLRAEQQILGILSAGSPSYGYRGEELGLVQHPADAAGHLWLVDPDDGTAAFEKGFRGAAVSIALLRGGFPVLGVVCAYSAPDDRGDLFTWAEGSEGLERNGRRVVPAPDEPLAMDGIVLVSQHADQNLFANATLAAPMRFHAVPSIAYRLALVASGEGQAAISLNGPVGWDYAGGHALLLGVGMDLFDANGAPVRYDRLGHSVCDGRCFGGQREIATDLAAKTWGPVLARIPAPKDAYSLCWPVRGSSVRDAGMLSRAQGCLLGQLAGDSLGSLVEFRSAADIAREHPVGVRTLRDGGTWNTLAGQPTDDSEMALILARSIVQEGGYRPSAAACAYAWWYESHPFDIGNTTRTAVAPAASALKAGLQPADEARKHANGESQANGALMRISPIGILGAGTETSTAIGWAKDDAALTHPNPVCQEANAVFAAAISFAIRTGEDPHAVYAHAIDTAHKVMAGTAVTNSLEAATNERPADYSRNMGWVLIALQNAFWQLLHTSSLEEGVVGTVHLGGDTDTNGAIAGALLGAVHGRAAVPRQWTNRILTCRPLAGIPGVARPRPTPFWPVDALWLAERLLFLGQAA